MQRIDGVNEHHGEDWRPKARHIEGPEEIKGEVEGDVDFEEAGGGGAEVEEAVEPAEEGEEAEGFSDDVEEEPGGGFAEPGGEGLGEVVEVAEGEGDDTVGNFCGGVEGVVFGDAAEELEGVAVIGGVDGSQRLFGGEFGDGQLIDDGQEEDNCGGAQNDE